MKTFLVTGATGATGSPTVKFLLEKGHRVNAFVRSEDARAQKLQDQGANVFVGDLLNLKHVRTAMEGVDGAYFCYPLTAGLVRIPVTMRPISLAAKGANRLSGSNGVTYRPNRIRGAM